jgi:CheY-like chemotaxis protein
VDGTFGRRHKGTGLGLTISREIARAMEGDITCLSTLDKGSAFTFRVPLPATPVGDVDLTLPLGDEACPSLAEDAPVAFVEDTPDAGPAREAAGGLATAGGLAHSRAIAKRHGKLGHVLLAEDNAVNALVAEATLANLGVAVTRVENGQQALNELQRDDHPYDMVLMDCQMPVLDGIEATRRLRLWEGERGRKPLPVVALTANAMATDRERCEKAGMDEHLPKPFKQSELEAALLRHLPALATRLQAKVSA